MALARRQSEEIGAGCPVPGPAGLPRVELRPCGVGQQPRARDRRHHPCDSRSRQRRHRARFRRRSERHAARLRHAARQGKPAGDIAGAAAQIGAGRDQARARERHHGRHRAGARRRTDRARRRARRFGAAGPARARVAVAAQLAARRFRRPRLCAPRVAAAVAAAGPRRRLGQDLHGRRRRVRDWRAARALRKARIRAGHALLHAGAGQPLLHALRRDGTADPRARGRGRGHSHGARRLRGHAQGQRHEQQPPPDRAPAVDQRGRHPPLCESRHCRHVPAALGLPGPVRARTRRADDRREAHLRDVPDRQRRPRRRSHRRRQRLLRDRPEPLARDRDRRDAAGSAQQ